MGRPEGPSVAALEFWLGVWRDNRDLLMHGRLRPERPDLSYPVVRADATARNGRPAA